MKIIHQRLFIVFSWPLVLISLAACGNATPDVERVETATVVEATQEVEMTVTVTETSTPNPPTSTPIPTITTTPEPTVEYSMESIRLTTEDEIDLDGRLFRSTGDIAVVFAHMAGEND